MILNCFSDKRGDIIPGRILIKEMRYLSFVVASAIRLKNKYEIYLSYFLFFPQFERKPARCLQAVSYFYFLIVARTKIKTNTFLIWFLVMNVLFIGKTETKYIKLKSKTQNNIVIFEIFHKTIVLLFWLFLKQFD